MTEPLRLLTTALKEKNSFVKHLGEKIGNLLSECEAANTRLTEAETQIGELQEAIDILTKAKQDGT